MQTFPSTAVLITLTLKADLADAKSREMVIERNFLSRKNIIRRVDGINRTEDEFDEMLTNALIPGHYGKKPTFRQIISHNIRYKDLSINNTLKTLDNFTRDDEYETLYLFLLGCHFEQGNAKQSISARIRVETAFKERLEAVQTRSAYETALALLNRDVESLNERKATFNVNADFENDLAALNGIKYRVSSLSSTVGRLKLRHSLIMEAAGDMAATQSAIDVDQLNQLYRQVSSRIGGIQKSFEDLLQFHNRMVEEKVRFLTSEIPNLDISIESKSIELRNLLAEEADFAAKIAKSDSFEELEALIIELNEKHRRIGEFETVIRQIVQAEAHIAALDDELAEIDDILFSSEFEDSIKTQVNKFNQSFSKISQELYGEKYALKFDRTTNKFGQKIYKFSAFNTNFSSGKKQGEISCFDIAYTLFADQEGISCLHFLLNDKKELMHDNQLIKIAQLVQRPEVNIQFVASILKDKLPAELNKGDFFVLQLSQTEKLFRIESATSSS